MEEKIILILQFGLEWAYLLLGFTALFGGKIKRRWLPVFVYAGFAAAVCQIDVHTNPLLMSRIEVIGFLLINMSCFFVVSARSTKKIRWILERLIILTYLDELMTMIVNSIVDLCGIPITAYHLQLFGYLVNTLMMILIATVYSQYGTGFFNHKVVPFLRKNMVFLLIFMAFHIMCLIISMDVLTEKYTDLKRRIAGKGIIFTSMVSIGIIVLLVLYVKKSNEIMEEMLVMERQMQEFQKNYYEMLLEKEADTKKYRHDMAGHLICLNRFAKSGDLEGIKAYIGEMNASFENIQCINFHTGLEVFDILLNYYSARLPQDTEVKIESVDDCTMDVSDMEQCMIFSNIIVNAVEAICKVERQPHYLHIALTKGRKYVQVSITNPMNEGELYQDADGKLQTSKEDKELHGMGLQNVERSVLKNSGRLQYHIKEKEFCCEVVLPITEPDSTEC